MILLCATKITDDAARDSLFFAFVWNENKLFRSLISLEISSKKKKV